MSHDGVRVRFHGSVCEPSARRQGSPTTRTAALLLLVVLAGCVTVKPQERKHLSKPEMTPETDALEDTFNAHIDAARRGASNGHGGGGGGCGCG